MRSNSISYALLISIAVGALTWAQDLCCQTKQAALSSALVSNGIIQEDAGVQLDFDSISVKRGGKIVELSLSSLKGKPDAEVTRVLAGLEIAQKMGTQQFEAWKAAMPGELSRRELTALADKSVFLSFEPRELAQTSPLDKEAQGKLLELVKAYVDKTMARLPNFFATQDVSTFQSIDWLRDESARRVHQPMHYVGEVTANVLYRGGREVVENGKGELKEADKVGYRLLFSGQFGPVLNTVLADAEQNKLTWSHWERSGSTQRAVFRYSVVRKKSHCKVKVVMPGNKFPSEARPGYHGEIALDPADGTILWLTLIADLNEDDPMTAANLMVEYGPVELGGQSYICPVRSVTVETVKEADPNGPGKVNTQWVGERQSHDGGMTYSPQADVPQEILINDVAFTHYQLLRSDAEMITGDDDPKAAPKQ